MTFQNYSLATNITGFPEAFDYASNTTASVLCPGNASCDMFGFTILIFIFFGFYIVSSKYLQQQAIIFSVFMSMVASFMMVWANMLNPIWAYFLVFAMMASAFYLWRDG